MSITELWESLNTAQRGSVIAIIVGLPVATYYPAMFGRVRWWESDIGKSMFMKGIALALVFWVGIGSLAALVFSWGWYDWLQLPVNWFLVLAVWYQVIVMRREQKSGTVHEKMGVSNDARTDS